MVKSIAPFVFFVMILFSASPSAWAGPSVFGKPYEWSLSAGPGFMYGTACEIAYKSSDSDDYISELQWNIKPLLFFGLDLEFSPKKPLEYWGFFAGLGLRAGLPMETGVIEDRDWLDPAAVPGSLTFFSSHENHTRAAFFTDLKTGISLPVSRFILKFSFTVDYRYLSWEAWDGYTQYGPNADSRPYIPWDSGFKKENIQGLGISYVQHWIFFAAGIGGAIPLGRFALSADVFFGLPVCTAIDDHHRRKPPFRTTGVMAKGFMVKPELGASFALSAHFDAGITAAYVYSKARGHTRTERQGEEWYWTKDTEGALFKAIEGTLALKYHF